MMMLSSHSHSSHGKAGHKTTKELLTSPSFLQSLTPSERSELLKPPPARHDSSRTTEAEAAPGGSAVRHSKSGRVSGRTPSGRHCSSPLRTPRTQEQQQQQNQQEQPSPWPAQQQQQHAEDKHRLLQDSMVLLEHRAQLQTQVKELQQQLAAMQRHHQQQQQHLVPADAATSHTVVEGLRASMAQVSSMASTVTQENRLLAADNARLTEQRDQHAQAIRQLQARIQQLEGNLLLQLQESSRETAKVAAEAAAAGSRLDALLSPELLAAAGCGGGGGGSAAAAGSIATGSDGALLEELASSNNQLRPLLAEVSALRRAKQSLERQASQLQQQLRATERDAQSAAAAAAAEKAFAGRTIKQAHQRLSAALQRIQGLAGRRQQQGALLQEREAYIARLERCLVQQNSELVRLAASSSNNNSGNSSSSAAHTSNRAAGHSLRSSSKGGGSSARPAAAAVQSPRGFEGEQQVLYRTPSPEMLSPRPDKQQQQQHMQEAVHAAGNSNHNIHDSSSRHISRSPTEAQRAASGGTPPEALAASRAAVAMQCRQIMAHTAAARAEAEEDADSHDHSHYNAAQHQQQQQQQRQQAARAAAAVGGLPSFTASGAGAGRLHRGPQASAGKEAGQQRSSNNSGSSAGSAAKRIAAAAAAVSALDTGSSRGLWGNTTTLTDAPAASANNSSGSGAARPSLQQQQREQRQQRLRELLQQKQRGSSSGGQQQQQVAAAARAAAARNGGRRSVEPLPADAAGSAEAAEQRYRQSARRAAAAAAAQQEQYEQQQYEQDEDAASSDVDEAEDLEEEVFGVRCASAPPPRASAASPRNLLQQLPPGSPGPLLDTETDGGDGDEGSLLMSEVLAMQQGLQELEQDMLQLGCCELVEG